LLVGEDKFPRVITALVAAFDLDTLPAPLPLRSGDFQRFSRKGDDYVGWASAGRFEDAEH